ncbi:MAG TPA: hypothetical protein VII99_10290 [Bacteroidia bacterium]
MPLLLLGFLKNNWEWVLLGIAILSLFAYVGTLKFEVSHYKSQAAEYHLALDAMSEKEKKLDEEAVAITRKYETRSTAEYQQQLKDAKLNEQRIKNDQTSRTIHIPLSAIELFNNTYSTTNQTTSATKPINVGQTGTSSQSGNNAGGNGSNTQGQPVTNANQVVIHKSIAPDDVGSEITLNDVLLVNNINRKRLLACNKQLDDWQSLWSDYSSAVKGNQ